MPPAGIEAFVGFTGDIKRNPGVSQVPLAIAARIASPVSKTVTMSSMGSGHVF
jgi:hypothetical protein